MPTLHADIAVIGGGLGGVAAAIAALRAGRTVVLAEEYEWLGGQLTSQAVPPDEHTWIEQFGATANYRRLRDGMRDYYRQWYPLTERARAERYLNPGAGLVSRLCVEPRVGAAVIDAMLAPYLSNGSLTVVRGVKPVAASVDGDTVVGVTVREVGCRDAGVSSGAGGGTSTTGASGVTGATIDIEAAYIIDATETGELLPLTGAEYVTGFEAQSDTGEPSAPDVAQPDNVQAFSWCFVVEHNGGNHVIDKPVDYDRWASFQPDFWGAPWLSLTAPDPRTLEVRTRQFTPTVDDDPLGLLADQRANAGDDELWTFRRIRARRMFHEGAFDSDLVLVNWPMIDYVGGSIIDSPDANEHLAASKRLSLSMLYWLQTEAPRPDGGTGWHGLKLRGDITGTADGLAMAPYIRESRRIRAEQTVTETHLSVAARGNDRPATFDDTVGVGMYRIDLHPSTGGDNYIDVASVPFEIPLGALIPQRMRNLLPACKNVGTTHLTNGAFRLHPVEWNLGEAAGALAAYCVAEATTPSHVRNTPRHLERFQAHLESHGVELHWPHVAGY